MKVACKFLLPVYFACVAASAHAGRIEHGGSLFTKSAKAESGDPVGCLYFTLTTAREYKKSWIPQRADFGFALQNIATDVKFGESRVHLSANGDSLADIKLEHEYGEAFEACLVPGEYEIRDLAFGTYETRFTPREYEPIRISLKAEDSLYIGNLFVEYPHEPGQPGVLYIRDRLDRDRPFLEKNGKHRLKGKMAMALLQPGNNVVVRKEESIPEGQTSFGIPDSQ